MQRVEHAYVMCVYLACRVHLQPFSCRHADARYGLRDTGYATRLLALIGEAVAPAPPPLEAYAEAFLVGGAAAAPLLGALPCAASPSDPAGLAVPLAVRRTVIVLRDTARQQRLPVHRQRLADVMNDPYAAAAAAAIVTADCVARPQLPRPLPKVTQRSLLGEPDTAPYRHRRRIALIRAWRAATAPSR